MKMVVIGIAGVILGLAGTLFTGVLGLWVAAVSFIGIIIYLFKQNEILNEVQNN
jgi:hypothetical protein